MLRHVHTCIWRLPTHIAGSATTEYGVCLCLRTNCCAWAMIGHFSFHPPLQVLKMESNKLAINQVYGSDDVLLNAT